MKVSSGDFLFDHDDFEGQPTPICSLSSPSSSSTHNCGGEFSPITLKDIDAPWTPLQTKYNIGNHHLNNYKDSQDSNRIIYNTELCDDGGSGETDQTNQSYQVSSPFCRNDFFTLISPSASDNMAVPNSLNFAEHCTSKDWAAYDRDRQISEKFNIFYENAVDNLPSSQDEKFFKRIKDDHLFNVSSNNASIDDAFFQSNKQALQLRLGGNNLMSPPIFPRVPSSNRSLNSGNRIGIADNQSESFLSTSRSSTPSNILPSSFSTFSPPTLLLPISTSRSSSPRSASPIVSMFKTRVNKKRERSKKSVVLPLKFSKSDIGLKNINLDNNNNIKLDKNNLNKISSINTDFNTVKIIQDDGIFKSPGSITQIKTPPTTSNGNNHNGMNNISKPNILAPPISCNCKKSQCLKLYCDCFKNQKYCEGCHCVNCSNTANLETINERRKAIEDILERSPDAFKPKVVDDQSNTNSKGHLSGCHCKKSNCLKKYCECFSGAVLCALRCRCLDCKNIDLFKPNPDKNDEDIMKESMKETIEVLLDIK